MAPFALGAFMVSQAAIPAETPALPRLAALRERMRALGVDALVVRATDGYLNEYVPVADSTRAWLTGFTGSMGDALVTLERALLFVDGRYTLQGRREAKGFEVRQTGLGEPIESGWLAALPELAKGGVRVLGVEVERVAASLFDDVARRAQEAGLQVRSLSPSPVAEAKDAELGAVKRAKGRIWPVARALSGRSVQERLALMASSLDASLDGFALVPLDEIAWLANLRGDHFPYQATFRARAVALKDRVLVAADPKALDGELEAGLELVGEGKLEGTLASLVAERGSLRLGYSPVHTPEAVRQALERAGCILVASESPYSRPRTTKTEAELLHMASAFARADDVVKRAQGWLHGQVSKGAPVTEAELAKKVRSLFKRSGALGLSFNVIAAAGKNGAVIHYGTPDEHTPLKEGELFLLDTGGYYEGGYATDLTRTFLLGKSHVKASAEQQRLFTLVLKGAIAGMSARFPVGCTGEQLDALVRAPLWAAGLNYAHGTGHGVGVNVHEFPPRLMPGNRTKVEPGQVFSIEPGVYLDGFGGVRIENLVTCVEDPEHEGFLRIRPLTFSPLDKRLIDRALLTSQEKAFLAWFAEGSKRPAEERLVMPLPPLA
jgi:Xaa-Pro aminopeptidase